jgi:hypothetical protein
MSKHGSVRSTEAVGTRDRFWFAFDPETIVRRKGLITGKLGETGATDFWNRE